MTRAERQSRSASNGLIIICILGTLSLAPIAVGHLQGLGNDNRSYNPNAERMLRSHENACRDTLSAECDALLQMRDDCERLGCTYDQYFTRARLAGFDLPPLYISPKATSQP